MTFNMPSYWIQAARFCQGGRQKLNNEWTTYTPSDFEECKNGTVLSAQKTCKNGLYAIKEETLKRVSIQYEPNMMERQMKNSHLFIGIPLSWNSIIFGSYCGRSERVTSMLVTDVGDEKWWWKLLDVGDGFGHFGHQHPLSFYISFVHQH